MRATPCARCVLRRSAKSRTPASASTDVLPFWFGESDRVTPAFIRDAASAALAAGATFYTHNLGIAPLRAALAELRQRTARRDVARSRRGDERGRQRADAGGATGGGRGRPRRRRDAAVAESGRDSEDSRRACRNRCARLWRARLATRPRAIAGGADAGHEDAAASTRRTIRPAG